MRDTKRVTEHLRNKQIHFLLSSPYKRSMDTIRDLAETLGMEIHTDEDLREREIGIGYLGDPDRYIRNMWADFSFKAEGAECLAEVQERNMRALKKILADHSDENLVIGTHGTALSSILCYYNPLFGVEDFFRLLNFRPYIIRLDFKGMTCVAMTEELIIER
jgi:2,3-bisphosphoglycerate-dependent phosphoglycerate mutase